MEVSTKSNCGNVEDLLWTITITTPDTRNVSFDSSRLIRCTDHVDLCRCVEAGANGGNEDVDLVDLQQSSMGIDIRIIDLDHNMLIIHDSRLTRSCDLTIALTFALERDQSVLRSC